MWLMVMELIIQHMGCSTMESTTGNLGSIVEEASLRWANLASMLSEASLRSGSNHPSPQTFAQHKYIFTEFFRLLIRGASGFIHSFFQIKNRTRKLISVRFDFFFFFFRFGSFSMSLSHVKNVKPETKINNLHRACKWMVRRKKRWHESMSGVTTTFNVMHASTKLRNLDI